MHDQDSLQTERLLALPPLAWVAVFAIAGGVGAMQWLINPYLQMSPSASGRMKAACEAKANCRIVRISLAPGESPSRLVATVQVSTNAMGAQRAELEESLRTAYATWATPLQLVFETPAPVRTPKSRRTSN